jgi:hypothetical protein
MNYNVYDKNYAAPSMRPEQQERPLTLFNTPQTSTQAQVAALRQLQQPGMYNEPPPPVRQALPEDAGLIARIRDNMAGGKADYEGIVGKLVSAYLNRGRG